MSTTTTALIRASMVSTVTGLLPGLFSPNRFKEHRSTVDLDKFCETAGILAAFRLFQIRDTFEHEETVVSNTDVEEVRTVMECRIAYPHSFQYGANHALSQDDVMNADLKQVRNAIGVNGYQTIEGAADACVFGESKTVERGTAVDFLVLRLSTQYYEDLDP